MLSEFDAAEVLEIVAEITLVIVLFTDASRIRLRLLVRQYQIPLRLLGVGLPLTVVLGAIAAKLIVPEFSIWEAALLAANSGSNGCGARASGRQQHENPLASPPNIECRKWAQ